MVVDLIREPFQIVAKPTVCACEMPFYYCAPNIDSTRAENPSANFFLSREGPRGPPTTTTSSSSLILPPPTPSP